jgi:hypothetical protein
MTNGPGKSDSPVVPEKSPNKAGQPVAEGTEGRGLAKGNLPQQNASRTPSRSDAPSALERVRQAAGKDKKLRFTALLHHIYNLETLRMDFSCPIFLRHPEARGRCSQSEWLLYGRDLRRSGGTGKAEDAKLPGAGIIPKQCARKLAAEKGWPTELGRSVRYRPSYVSS